MDTVLMYGNGIMNMWGRAEKEANLNVELFNLNVGL